MMCVCLDGANWLTFFCQPVKSWNGLVLRKPIDMEKRELIQKQEATLLDLRSYLFARQCTLLLFLQRPWEVAQRALELLHSCVQELKLLEVRRAGPGFSSLVSFILSSRPGHWFSSGWEVRLLLSTWWSRGQSQPPG